MAFRRYSISFAERIGLPVDLLCRAFRVSEASCQVSIV
jgi:hypothetical protein